MPAESNQSDAALLHPIWNPDVAANWSLLFTPAFGAYLQMLNWEAMGEAGRATTAKVWFYVSVAILITSVAVLLLFPAESEAARVISKLPLPFLFIWYFAAARKQARYVREKYGTSYAKKSWGKPIGVGVGAVVLYVAAISTALALANNGERDADASSTGSLHSFASLFRGKRLDCAQADVKQIITENYQDQLARSGVPDLVNALAQERVKLHVEMITETSRNDQSENVQCSGKLVFEFPKDDLDRASRTEEAKVAEITQSGFKVPSDPVFSAMVTYLVSYPVDEQERKNGPVVKMTLREDAEGSGLGQYIATYSVLAFAARDIEESTKNGKAWQKEWKIAAVQGCGKQSDPRRCECKMDHFEKVLGQDDMARIGYVVKTSPLAINKYPNFIALSQNLEKQCELGRSPEPAPVVPEKSTVATHEEQPRERPPTTEVAEAKSIPATEPEVQKPIIDASFDCLMATTKVEKLICAAPETASADKRLAAAYKQARAKPIDVKKLKADQQEWIRGERNTCSDAACLLKVVEKRIDILSRL